MNEIRRDYFLPWSVVVATARAKRPHEFRQERDADSGKTCFFCPGNEHMTPETISEIKEGDSWKMRTFLNKFPAVEPYDSYAFDGPSGIIQSSPAYGYHEVLVETNDHNKQLWDLDKDELEEYLNFTRERFIDLKQREGIEYVSIFKNHGRKGGTSIYHSHTQIIAYSMVAPRTLQKIEAASGHEDIYGKIVDEERNSERLIAENNSFIAIAPYASRYSFETWILPVGRIVGFDHMKDYEIRDLAEMLHIVLTKLKTLNASYNFHMHYAPHEQFRFHIEVTPRLNTFAGFEIGNNCFINSMLPEHAAAFYRGEIE